MSGCGTLPSLFHIRHVFGGVLQRLAASSVRNKIGFIVEKADRLSVVKILPSGEKSFTDPLESGIFAFCFNFFLHAAIDCTVGRLAVEFAIATLQYGSGDFANTHWSGFLDQHPVSGGECGHVPQRLWSYVFGATSRGGLTFRRSSPFSLNLERTVGRRDQLGASGLPLVTDFLEKTSGILDLDDFAVGCFTRPRLFFLVEGNDIDFRFVAPGLDFVLVSDLNL